MIRVLVVIPTYREKENIVRLIPEVRSVVAREGYDGHVLVIDDSSPDGTGHAVRQMAGVDSSLHLLERPGKLGLGSAYLDGFRWSLDLLSPDVFVTMDADFSHPPSSLPSLVRAVVAGADVAVGSRYTQGGGAADWASSRQLVSRVANALVHILLGLTVRDATSGFRALSRRAVEVLLKVEFASKGYAYQVESLYTYFHSGLTVAEVPFLFLGRSAGKTKLSVSEMLLFAVRVVNLRLRGWQKAQDSPRIGTKLKYRRLRK